MVQVAPNNDQEEFYKHRTVSDWSNWSPNNLASKGLLLQNAKLLQWPCQRFPIHSCITGEIEEIIFEAMLLKKANTSEFVQDKEYINGLQSHEVLLQRHIPFHQSKVNIRILEFLMLIFGLREYIYIYIFLIFNDVYFYIFFVIMPGKIY